MGMNIAEIDLVVAELGDLVGGRLDDAWQPARDRVFLAVRGERLLLVPRGEQARLHRVEERTPNPARPFSFQGALRARVGTTLRSVGRLAGERAVEFVFADLTLHLRLTGRSGGLWLIVDGRPIAAYDGPAQSLPPFAAHTPRQDPARWLPDAGPWGTSRAAARFFDAEERAAFVHQQRTTALSRAGKEVGRLTRRLEHLDEDLRRARTAGDLRREADLLSTVLHRVPRGAPNVQVEDDAGDEVLISLDPGRTPAANLQALYTRAKRLERAHTSALERQAATRRDLEALRTSLATATADGDRLPELLRLVPSDARPKDLRPGAVPWKVWRGPGGQEVWVGKDAGGNRRLTFQRARGKDWWMHLRDSPGAHLVIPMSSAQTPALDLLLAAAQICLATARTDPGVARDVMYTRVRDVRAIPGEAGGRVIVHGEHTLRVSADPTSLARWSVVAPEDL